MRFYSRVPPSWRSGGAAEDCLAFGRLPQEARTEEKAVQPRRRLTDERRGAAQSALAFAAAVLRGLIFGPFLALLI